MDKILIIGGGEIGGAIDFLLVSKSIRAAVYDADPAKSKLTVPLDEFLPSADFIFLCVPSGALSQSVKEIRPRLVRETIVVSLIKGIDVNSGRWTDEVLREAFGENFALISGPMLSEEIMAGLPARAVCAGSEKVCGEVTALFDGSALSLVHSGDTRGVAVCGVLKNIYAIALGMTDAINKGDNVKGAVAVQAMTEMRWLIENFGGVEESVWGLAGLGDFLATGSSSHSRNYLLGQELARKGGSKIQSEGYISMPTIAKFLGKKINDFPLLSFLFRMRGGSKVSAAEFFAAAGLRTKE